MRLRPGGPDEVRPGAHLFLSSPDDDCRLGDYRRMKTKVLELHERRSLGSQPAGAHTDNMAARRQLVDAMFRRFDSDSNGQVESREISQVSPYYTWILILYICIYIYVAAVQIRLWIFYRFTYI